ncbi:MAG TPA: signal peptidase I [Spirochaetia bacterium]|nr:signal peptidase I [Spirochaetia bacterium]
MGQWYVIVQRVTERALTSSKRRRIVRKEKQKKKNPVLDWVEAFLWAAVVVLIINQYFFQAYQIPSESMMNTLLVGDRIFVNKLVYGPELVPGMLKMPGFTTPKRDTVIIFENPLYLSKGPVFDLVQRVLYMLTLSIVNIDVNKQGQPLPHFLIKRAIGVGGDRLRILEGSVSLQPAGIDKWLTEADFKKISDADYQTRRLLLPSDYKVIHAQALVDAEKTAGLSPDPVAEKLATQTVNAYGDQYEWMGIRYRDLYEIYPESRDYGTNWSQFNLGWYIPKGWVFPMGDNRDNSKDARYFGPVRLRSVLGKAMFKYWPLTRIGPIR